MSDNRACLPCELHSRTSVGIQVSLWWSPADGRTWVAVRDVRPCAMSGRRRLDLPVLTDERDPMPPAPAVPRAYGPHPMGPPTRPPVWYAGRRSHARLSARALGTGSAQEVV